MSPNTQRGLAMSWRCATCGASGAILIDPTESMESIDLKLTESHASICENCPRLRLISQWSPE